MAKEHISFHFEPGFNTFTYNAPKTCSSEEQEKNYSKKLKSKSIELHYIQVTGCDRTAVNTKEKKRE